jgi:3-hydroxyisobutyrate dehydrogenase-like beta-hydroxyacid dehydrogenase
MSVIGLLHPGEMGAAVGACLVNSGHSVLWDPSGRSPSTARRAASAGLLGASLASIAAQSDVVISVCPPAAALEVARLVAAAGFGGTYLDANAVSPATAGEVAAAVRPARYVDGGIIGSPPVRPGTTRLYLSDAGASDVAGLFAGAVLDARVLSSGPYAASALKMSYAAWTKGSAALLLAARELARAEGVDSDLLAEWEISQPGLLGRWERAAASREEKGWRWIGEMTEIAATMRAEGLTDGFHLAAAQVFGGGQPLGS